MLTVERKSISLTDITGLSPLNPRHHHPKAGIAELAASLREAGQIEALGVHAVDGKFQVLSGGRRFKALKQLAKEGHAWGGQEKGQVRVDIFAGDEAELAALALAANVIREQMHPVDEYEAFAALNESMDIPAIARAFGREEREVRRSLALGRLAPEVRKAWRAGALDADAAKAFTKAASLERQVEILEELKRRKIGKISKYSVESCLGDDSIGPTDDVALFVGEEAYRSAGGRVAEDLFDDEITWADGALCRKLADDKLAGIAERIKAEEGWGFYRLDYVNNFDGNFIDVEPDFLEEETKRIAAIQVEIADLRRLANKLKGQPRDEKLAIVNALREEERAIEGRAELRAIPQADRAKMGFTIGLDGDGGLEIMRCYKLHADAPASHDLADQEDEHETDPPRPSSRRGTLEAAAAVGADPAAASDVEPEEKPSTSVRALLDRTINLAFARSVVSRPDVALAVTLLSSADLTGRVFNVRIEPEFDHEDFDRQNPLIQALDRLTVEKSYRLVNEAALADLTSAFCFAVACSVIAEGHHFDAIGDFAATIVARGVDLRAELLRAFDYVGYFTAATKDAAIRAIEALDGPAAAVEARKLKKDALTARAATLAKDRQWLPTQLELWFTEAAAPTADTQEAAE